MFDPILGYDPDFAGLGGGYDMYGPPVSTPRITRGMIEEFLSVFIGVPMFRLKFVKLDELPTQWKHACTEAGVSELKSVQVVAYDFVPVQFAFCPACGKVQYYYEKPY